MTSAMPAHRTMSAGCRWIDPFHTLRWAASPAIARTNQLATQGRSQLGNSPAVGRRMRSRWGSSRSSWRKRHGGPGPLSELGFTHTPWMSRAGSAITIWSRPVRTTSSSWRSSRRTRTTTSRAVRQPRRAPLADLDHELGSRPLFRCRVPDALGRQVEQMPGHALADRGECAAGEFRRSSPPVRSPHRAGLWRLAHRALPRGAPPSETSFSRHHRVHQRLGRRRHRI